MQPDESTTLEPTVAGAMRRYWWLVLVGGVLGGVLGLALAESTTTEYTAAAVLIVEDPRLASLSGTAPTPERYVADQVAIIESTLVAEEASQVAAAAGTDLSSDDLENGLTVSTFANSNRVVIVYQSPSLGAARLGADAIAEAYQEVRRTEARRNFADTLERLDRSIETLNLRVTDIQARLTVLTTGDVVIVALNDQYRDALRRLITLQIPEDQFSDEELANLSSAEQEALAEAEANRRDQLDDVAQQLRTLQIVRSLESVNPEVSELVEEQRLAILRRDAVAQQRDQVALDAEIAGTGVVLVSPAREAAPVGSDTERTVAVGAVLGLLAGGSGAYLLSLRRRRLANKMEPEAVLGVPLIVDIPNFAGDKVRSKLPVRTAPASASAEAFRFVAAALDVGHPTRHGNDAPGQLILFTSPLLGDGKTTVTANTALAAARRGWRVLAVDVDFADQAMTRLLLDGEQPSRGLTQVLSGEAQIADVVETLEVGGEASFDLLSRGSRPASASDMFRSNAAREFFAGITSTYDIVLVDSPAVLHTAYASTLSSYADRAVVVVPHRAFVRDLEAFRDRVALVGTSLSGYVYNKAPLPFRASYDDGSAPVQGRRWFSGRS
jgi:Mrp family chromosome partitioning ATPase